MICRDCIHWRRTPKSPEPSCRKGLKPPQEGGKCALFTSKDLLRKRIVRSKRRGRYAERALARMIAAREGWAARNIPVSGAGSKAGEISVFPDVEAFYNREPGIYIAFEVKSSKGPVIYLDRPNQILKLFGSMNTLALYRKRYAVLVCHFGKRWRFLILRSRHAKLNYMRIDRDSKTSRYGRIFDSLDDLLQFVLSDTKVGFPAPEEEGQIRALLAEKSRNLADPVGDPNRA